MKLFKVLNPDNPKTKKAVFRREKATPFLGTDKGHTSFMETDMHRGQASFIDTEATPFSPELTCTEATPPLFILTDTEAVLLSDRLTGSEATNVFIWY